MKNIAQKQQVTLLTEHMGGIRNTTRQVSHTLNAFALFSYLFLLVVVLGTHPSFASSMHNHAEAEPIATTYSKSWFRSMIALRLDRSCTCDGMRCLAHSCSTCAHVDMPSNSGTASSKRLIAEPTVTSRPQ